MAKNQDVVIVPMTKKQKVLNAFKIAGISVGAVLGIIAVAVLYVFISGGFNPPYVPLTDLRFSKNEYVISELDNLMLVPNEGCTELDNIIITIEDTNKVTLVEDDYTHAKVENEQEPEDGEPLPQDEPQETTVANKYYVTIGQNIQIKPVTQKINQGTPDEKEINVGGWVRLTAEHESIPIPIAECWVFVDVPVGSLDLVCNTQLEEVEEQPAQDEPEVIKTYYVNPGQEIELSVANQLPVNSLNVPSTSLPFGKENTSYTSLKTLEYDFVKVDDGSSYVVPDNAEFIASNKIKVGDKAEGSFTVFAYVIAKYNDIGKEPNLDDYTSAYGEKEGYINWEQDFDLIRVKTQKIKFVIKQNQVEGVTVAKSKLTYPLLANNIKLYINPQNTTTNYIDAEHSTQYHYGLDIQLSSSSDIKNELYNDIELFAGYIDASSAEAIPVGDKLVVFDDTYFKAIKSADRTWNVVVNEYRASENVLVFGYPLYENDKVISYLYDYVEVEIQKTAIKGLTFNNLEKEITLAWNDASGVAETKDLANTVSVYPSNATYNKYVQYFALADNEYVEVDSSIKIKTIDDKVYYAICKTDKDGNKHYNIINPIKAGGKTNIVAVALMYDANGELIEQDGYYKCDYVGHLNESITVNVVKKLKVEKVDVLDSQGNSMLNNNTVTIAKGDIFIFEITCDETVLNDSVFTWAVEGDANQGIISQTNSVKTEDTKLIYTLTANNDGSVALYVADADGDKISYIENINIEIVNTELKDLTLSTNAENGVSVKLTSSDYLFKILDQNGNLTSEDFKLSVEYDPIKTNNKTITIAAYELPQDFKIEMLESLSPTTLTQSDVLTFEQNYDDGENIVPVINKPGKVVVFAVSLSGDIVSNPVIVEVTLPDIRVEFSNGNTQQIISVAGDEKSLINYDQQDTEQDINMSGSKFRIGVYEKTTDTVVNNNKTYYLLENNDYVQVSTPSVIYINDYYEFIDISALVNYKFAGDYTVDESDNQILISENGTKINNRSKTLVLSDIDSNLQEIIVMTTEFGFESTSNQNFIYNLIADYNVQTIANKYYAPSEIDIFGDGSVKFTNKAGNILYLPIGYDINNLTADYRAQFDDIKCNLTISLPSTLCSFNSQNGKIKLLGVPNDETTISATISVLKADNNTTGFSAQYLFTILPGVISDFENNTLIVDTTIQGTEGNYTFASGNVVDLSDKLTYTITNSSTVEVKSINFVTGYISLVGVDALDGNKIVKYELTSDTEIDYSKTYYIQTQSGYQVAEKPTPISLGYYELNEKYVLSNDTEIDYSKTYYIQTQSGYQVAEKPTPISLGYYEFASTYAELDIEKNTITLTNKLLENDISNFQIKLEVVAKVQNGSIRTNITSYYIIKFELPQGN